MTNQISHFYFKHSSVRVQVIDNEPWFCLRDVIEVLDIPRTSDLAQPARDVVKNDTIKNRGSLDPKGVEKIYVSTISSKQQMLFINEPNLYRVIFRSNKPEARQFQDWVFNEVLPSIRKTGSYHQPEKNRRISAAEPLSSTDTQNLKYLIQKMTGCFKFQRSWNNAVWYALRRATGVSSPEPFSVDDLPILTEECRRIIEITGLLSEHFRRCEKETIRRIVKNREDCDIVIRELQREWQNSGISTSALRQLELHEQRALGKFENRLAI